MSYYNRYIRSNGLSKSSSQPNYLIPYELNDYNKIYLPLIKLNQQAEILSDKINKSNQIKDEILTSKYKLLYDRGINTNSKNKFRDSWYNFFKRKERERKRKKIYKIIKDDPYISSEDDYNDDNIFRKDLNYLPNKIEDKIKLKQYLPAKRDLAKLMFRVNDNINERIDKNSYLLSKNIRILENGYEELKNMINHKINKIEKKQEEDFYNLRQYFIRRAQRERTKFDNNQLILEYEEPNMKDNIEKLQTYEISNKIQNIPYIFDNAIRNIEDIRNNRKQEKNNFLFNFANDINRYQIEDDFIGENSRYDSSLGYNVNFLTRSTPNFIEKYSHRKPRTDYGQKENSLSMSKSDISNLKKNLKPLSYQMPKYHRMNLDDAEDRLTADDLKEIYKQRNSKILSKKGKKVSSNSKINIKENETFNKLSKKKSSKKDTNKSKKDNKDNSENDIVVVDSDEDKSKSQKKETKEEKKEEKNEETKEEKKEEKQEEQKEEQKEEAKEEQKEETKEEQKEESQKESEKSVEESGEENDEENNENEDGN